MGLSGPKKRNKISSDPNNTTWANNKDGYGQKILASQGWTPGDYLGAKSANHADHYTAANASHIRVLLREDNLGLGAQVGKSTADTFGLATLSGIFGRLNGKSDAEIQKQQDVQRDLQLQTYQTTKYGTMNFVSGGLLVGDKMEFPSQPPAATKVNSSVKKGEATKTERSKKRKVSDEEVAKEPSSAKKRKQDAVFDDKTQGFGPSSEEDSSATERKNRKKRRHEAGAGEDVAQGAADGVKSKKSKDKKKTPKDSSSKKALLKEEKRARKEERRLRRERKEEKRRQKGAKLTSTTSSKSASTTSSDTETSTATPVAAVQVQAPAMFGGSRHAVRQRYIMQKRLASMDPRAVQEILMLKTSA